MDKDFEPELKGSSIEAAAAKEQIAEHFNRYGGSGHQEARKHQLIFASKIMCVLSKCENKHSAIYCNIIAEVFADKLYPEASAKYWTLYVNCMRYFHYFLVDKKEFGKASLIYRHIISYSNKLQNSENGLTFINICCYQLFLQNSLKSKNHEQALKAATDVVENLTTLFNEILETNTNQNFQYPDILKKALSCLFPQNKAVTVYQFLKILPEGKVKQMFRALFTLYGHQTIAATSNEDDVQEHAKYIMEAIYTLLKVDINDKMQLQLSVQLMYHCRSDGRLQTNKPISESLHLLYDYLTLLCAQKFTFDFQRIYSMFCERFKAFFEKHSKSVVNQAWFGDFLVTIFYLHSELQNLSVFSCFWKQMSKPDNFKDMFQFFVELMKLAPCISAESKLLIINCCKSIRKHVVLSFAQIALTGFVFYCQNVNAEDEEKGNGESSDGNVTDYYKEMIQNNLILIINHAFKIIDKMDCITSDAQEIEIILTRFKQVTLSCRTSKQAGTCVSICELFLKLKTKIASNEWPLLLRRLYKTATQLMSHAPHIGREIQMCYITSMLHDTVRQIDLNQIRTQINIFYATGQQEHEHCLLHLHSVSSSLLRPHLDPSRKRLLHWLESPHVLKYYKSNTALVHSIVKSSQSHYDFVLIIKLGKQQTYAMAKVSSLYKTLKSKKKSLVALSRLEQLTFGHLCVLLLNEMTKNQKRHIDSKDLSEEQLENLFKREEMSSISIYNDLKYFKLAWEAFKAFEDFYDKFDSENISMDDAIIDWESLLDDLGGLALCLQLSGYVEHSSKAWLLHYNCSRLIQDDVSALRGLSFFCEYSEHYQKNSNSNHHFKLDEEIQSNFPAIIQGLENLSNLQREAHQSYILLALLQIAHYYARSSRFTFAQMLFQYVEQKHADLAERHGCYDIVLATMDAIKFRLLWKHCDDTNATVEEKSSRTTAENLLLHRCLLHDIEETLDRFHDFSCISSCDGVLYSILVVNLVQQLAECTINRLCDNFINALFIATCKCTLQLDLVLRFVQVMSMWMWMNLQMEYIDKAQVKLKIIEYVMGMKRFPELTNEKCTKSLTDIQSSTLLPTVCAELLTPRNHNPAMEAIRKFAQVQLSPIKTNKLQLSPSHRNSDLHRYFKCNIDTKLLPQNEQIEWTFFMVGCLNARLYFLVEDYDQLETFYEKCSKWLQMRQNCFNKNYYKNIQLMAMQHYANFLRSQRQHGKALKCLEYGIELCENKNFYIDAVYSVNFKLQLLATKKEMNRSKNAKFKLPTHSKLRRALQFNISPEDKQHETPAKSGLKEKTLQDVMSSDKKSSEIVKALQVNANDGSCCSSSKKIKTQAVVDLSGSSSDCGTSSDLELNSTKLKPKFKICEDIVEVIDNIDNVIVVNDAKSIKRTNIEENYQMYKTPKVVRKTTKSSKATVTKSSVKSKRPDKIPQFHIDINLDDNLSPSSMNPSNLLRLNSETKGNLNSNELVPGMQNLEIKSSKATKTLAKEIDAKNTKSRRKPNPIEEAPLVIVLEDSPCTEKPNQIEFADKAKSNKTCATAKDPYPYSREHNLASLQKQLMVETDDKPNLENEPPLTWSTTPIVTRRRQKKLV